MSTGSVDALTPSLDNPSSTQLEVERLAAIVGSVKLGSVARKCAPVVHINLVTLDGFAAAFHLLRDLDLETLGHRADEGKESGGESEEEGRATHVSVGLWYWEVNEYIMLREFPSECCKVAKVGSED